MKNTLLASKMYFAVTDSLSYRCSFNGYLAGANLPELRKLTEGSRILSLAGRDPEFCPWQQSPSYNKKVFGKLSLLEAAGCYPQHCCVPGEGILPCPLL